MSTNPMSALIGQFAQMAMQNVATPVQPNTVINVGQPLQAPVQGGFGDPFAGEYDDPIPGYGMPRDEVDYLPSTQGVQIEEYSYGDPESELRLDQGFVDTFAQQLLSVQGNYGSPDSYGGLWDRLTGAARQTVNGAANATIPIVSKVNALVTKVNNNGRAIGAATRMVSGIKRTADLARRETRANNGMIRKLYKVIDAEFGQKGMWQRVALNTAQALPGVRALNLFESEQYQGALKSLIDLGDSFEDMKRNTEDDEYTLTPTAATPTAAEVKVQVGELALAIEDLRKDMIYITDAHKAAKIKTTHEALELAKKESIISEIAKITPSQITRKGEAMYEAVAKYVLGQVPSGTSGSGFNFSLGI
jgi:hypothetical protein